MLNKKDIEAIKLAVHEEIAPLKKDVAVIKKNISSLDKKVDSLDKKVVSLDKKVDSLDKKVDSLSKRVSKLEKGQKTIINFFDKRDLLSDRRINRIEKHLNMPELH